MNKKILLSVLLTLLALPLKAQDKTEIKVMAKVLSQLTAKATQENDKDAVLLFTNTWHQIKEGHPELLNDQVFIKVEEFFDEVLARLRNQIGKQCFSLEGSVSLNVPNLGTSSMVVLSQPGGWTYHVLPTESIEGFDLGILRNSDIQMISILRIIEDNEIAELNQSQIDILQKYHSTFENKLLKNSVTGRYHLPSGLNFETNSQAEKHIQKKDSFNSILEKVELKNLTPNTKLEKQKIRQQIKLEKALDKLIKIEAEKYSEFD